MYTVPDNKVHADNVGRFASSSVHHHRPSYLQPHIVAIVSEETIVASHRLALLTDWREGGREGGRGGREEGEGGREGGRGSDGTVFMNDTGIGPDL